MMLIYSDERIDESMSEAEMGQLLADFGQFHETLAQAGCFLAGARLRPTSSASTVRVREGKASITDGPFAETKEHLGGYYLIEAADLEEALEWARKIPSARYGSIEVRPLWEME